MEEIMTVEDCKKLSQDVSLMIKDNQLLRLTVELLILSGRGLLGALNYPAENMYPIAEDLFKAIQTAEKCIGNI